MSLHQYKIDFSQLTSDEKTDLIKHIEPVSFNGLHWYPDFQSAIFSLEREEDLRLLNIPEKCRLSHCQLVYKSENLFSRAPHCT